MLKLAKHSGADGHASAAGIDGEAPADHGGGGGAGDGLAVGLGVAGVVLGLLGLLAGLLAYRTAAAPVPPPVG